jgi:aminoglycoside phosphotransferase (APT) family kinase protein
MSETSGTGAHASPAAQRADAVDGIDVAAVTTWLADRLDWLAPPLRFTKLEGGHSNFTYRVRGGDGRDFVLRRPPLGELLPMAHDMGREFTLISALWPTSVPVPEPLAFCEDREVTGAPFFAMGFVDGGPIYTEEDVEARIGSIEARGHTAASFIDTLAALHAVDPDEVGLGALGKRDSYVARQLHRWNVSWEASKNRELPGVERLHDLLLEHLPEQVETRVVHGDYGLHNCVVGLEGQVLAVVDWEISTLGDPLADFAYALNWWDRDNSPTRMEGFDPPERLVELYGDATGRDLSQIDYYRCFNHWKTICILQGVYARYLHGQKSTEGVDLDDFPLRIDEYLEKGLALAEGF